MKLALESTMKIVDVKGVPARVWIGTFEGQEIYVMITKIVLKESATDEMKNKLGLELSRGLELNQHQIALLKELKP